MKWRNGGLAGILLTLFALLVVWRVLSPPRQREGLYRCLPENSLVAVSVFDPLPSLDRYLGNPVVTELSATLGWGDSAALAQNDVLRGLAGWLCGDRVVAAWVPATDHRTGPSWIATTAPAGWRSAVARFFLWIRYVPGLGRLRGGEDGIRYVRIVADDSRRSVLSLAMLDGVLMVAYGEGTRNLANMRQHLLFMDRLPAVFGKDRPWKNALPDSLGVWVNGDDMPWGSGVRIDVQSDAEGSLRLLGHVRGLAGPKWTNNKTPGIGKLIERIPMEGSAALLAVSGDVFARFAAFGVELPGEPPPGDTPDWVVVNVSFRPYEGRLMGIAVPAFSMRWRRDHPLELREIDHWIDGLNRQARLGLIRRGIEKVDGRRDMLLDSSLFGRGLLGRDDSSGLLSWHDDGTVELATSAASSRGQAAAGADVRTGRLGRWLDERAAASGMLAGGWVSGGDAAEALRNSLAVYRLLTMLRVVENADVRPDAISVAADVLDALDRFGPIRWSVRAGSPGELSGRIHLGPSGLPVRP